MHQEQRWATNRGSFGGSLGGLLSLLRGLLGLPFLLTALMDNRQGNGTPPG